MTTNGLPIIPHSMGGRGQDIESKHVVQFPFCWAVVSFLFWYTVDTVFNSTFHQVEPLLKADSHELNLICATATEGCVETNRKFPISAAAMQPSATAACIKHSSCESALRRLEWPFPLHFIIGPHMEPLQWRPEWSMSPNEGLNRIFCWRNLLIPYSYLTSHILTSLLLPWDEREVERDLAMVWLTRTKLVDPWSVSKMF